MGGTVINGDEVKQSMLTGTGKAVKIRAKIEYIPDKNMLVATEIPFSVYTDTIDNELAELINSEENHGIVRYIDATNDEGARINIYLAKGANVKKIVDLLYKSTSLESYYSINLIMLEDGRFPRTYTWRNALKTYIAHIRTCKRNEVQFDLNKAIARKNIVDGLIKAYSIIDKIVTLIRASSSPAEASEKLMSTYEFNENQAKAILAMKLSSLTKLDIVKLNDELAQLTQNIEWYNHILSCPSALDEELIKILREVANKFGLPRKTKVLNLQEKDEEQCQIQQEEVNIMLFDNNMIRLVKKEDMQGGKRGRKGVNIKPPKNANLINTLYGTNLSTLMAFSSKGKMYNFSLADLDIGKDYSIYELIQLSDEEKILMLIDSSSFNAYKYLITISKNGYIKKSNITEYNSRQKRGVVAVKLENNDSIINVFLSSSNEDRVFIVGNEGNYNFYPISEISSTGRATKGVKAIKLDENEFIQTATIVKSNIKYKGIFTVSSSGKGKITKIEEFPETSRAVKGPQAMSLKEDRISAAYACPIEKDNIYVVAGNHANLISLDGFSTQGRMTSGVKIIDVKNKVDIEII